MGPRNQKQREISLEALEPRLLLSADFIAQAVAPELVEDPASAIMVPMQTESTGQAMASEDDSSIFSNVQDEALPMASTTDGGLAADTSGQSAGEDEPDQLLAVARSGIYGPVEDTLISGTPTDLVCPWPQQMVTTLNAANAPPVMEAALDAVLSQARANWAPFLPSAELSERLSAISVSVADLPAGILGETRGLNITLDTDAAGYGWSTSEIVDAGRIDLLTVVTHEMGHVLGLEDSHPSTEPDLMSGIIASGVRILPHASITVSADSAPMELAYAAADAGARLADGLSTISGAVGTIIAENENFTDPFLPGLRFDFVEEGDAGPTVEEALSTFLARYDADPNYMGSVEANAYLAGAGLTLSDPFDPVQIADLIYNPDFDNFFISGGDDVIALSLMDMDDSGNVTLEEAYEVLVVGHIRDFLNDYPSHKYVWDGDNHVLTPITILDLNNGFTHSNGSGSFTGLANLISTLNQPSYLNDYIGLSTSGFADNTTLSVLSYEVTFNLTMKQEYLVDLGIATEELEIQLPLEGYQPGPNPSEFVLQPYLPEPYVEAHGNLSLPLDITASTTNYTFLPTDDIDLSVTVGESLANMTVHVGFLGMQGDAMSEFLLNFPVDLEVIDPSSPYHLGFGQPDFAWDGDGVISFDSNGEATATFAVPADKVALNNSVSFGLAFGTHSADPVAVTVLETDTYDNDDGDPTPTEARLRLVDDINLALDAAGIGDVVSASLNIDDLIVLSLVDSDATDLGFAGQEHYAAPGSGLTATSLLSPLGDGDKFDAKIIVSLGGDSPVLINFSFILDGDNAIELTASFLTQAQADIDDALGSGELTISLDMTGHIKLTPDNAPDSLEITRTAAMEAEFLILRTELTGFPPEDLLAVYPDADLDFVSISLPLDVKTGLTVSYGDLSNEELVIYSDELIVEDSGSYTYPMNDDIAEDSSGFNRFVLADYLTLSGVPYDSNFDESGSTFLNLLDFNAVGPAEVSNLLGQLRGWLDRLTTSGMLGGFDVPFTTATLGNLLRFGDLLQQYLLFDDGGDGIDPVDKDPPLNDHGRLIFVEEDANQNQTVVLAFATAQELAFAMAHQGVASIGDYITIGGNTAHYKLTENIKELTYDVKIIQPSSYYFQPQVDFSVDTDPIKDVLVESNADLYATLTFNAIIGLNLETAVLISDGTLLSDLNNDTEFPIRTDLAVTGAGDVNIAYGRLSDDASIHVYLPSGNYVVKIHKSLGPDAFDPALAVDVDADSITYLDDHGLLTGDAVRYDNGGGDNIDGLISGETYYVVRISSKAIQLAETYNKANLNIPMVVDLASIGSGASHTLQHRNYTDDNLTTSDLIADMNEALATAGIDSSVEAMVIGGQIVLQAVDPAMTGFGILTKPNDPAFLELGFSTNTATTVYLTGVEITDPGNVPDTATFFVEVNNSGIGLPVNVENMAGSNSVADIVNDINDALEDSLVSGLIVAARNGNQIVLAAVDASVDVFQIGDGTNSEFLGLSSSQLENQFIGSVYHSRTAGVFLIGENFLDPLVNGYADIPANRVASAFGRLQNNGNFTFSSGGSPYSISIAAGDTTEFTDIQQLIDLINEKIDVYAIGDHIDAYLIGSSQIGLYATAGGLSNITSIEITAGAPELGLLTQAQLEAIGIGSGARANGDLRIAANKAAPYFYGPTQDAYFEISYTDGDGAQGPVNVTVSSDEAIGNRSIYDLVADINLALKNAFKDAFEPDIASPFEAAFDGQRLVIRARATSGITDFEVKSATLDTAVTELHLHGYGTLVGDDQILTGNRADLLIFPTDQNLVYEVALDSTSPGLFSIDPETGLYVATTVGEVLAGIDDVTGGVIIETGFNSTHTGLKLIDNSGGDPANIFYVSSVNASRSAFALGLGGSSELGNLINAGNAPPPVPSVPPVIDGDPISRLELQDRFFVRQKDADTPVLSATIYAGFNMILGSENFPEAYANYGFVGVVLTNFAHYVAHVEIDLNMDTYATPAESITLSTLLNSLSKDLNKDGVVDIYDLREVIHYPEMTMELTPGEDTLTFKVTLEDGLPAGFITDLGLPGTATVGFRINNPGNPFFEKPGTAPFDGTDGGIVDVAEDKFILNNHGFEEYDTVTYRAGEGGTAIEGLTDNTQYVVLNVTANTFQLSPSLGEARLETPVKVDLTDTADGGTEHRFLRFDPVAPEIEIIESAGFGTLFEFGEISFDTVLTALQQLRDFLNKFAALDFITEQIPVIGSTLNDLIGVAVNFAKAVDDATNNPAASLQKLTQKLRESFGLPKDTDPITFELVDDKDGADGNLNDMLKISLNLDRIYTESMMMDLDFGTIVKDESEPVLPTDPDFGVIKLLGNAGLKAEIDIDVIVSVGIDLDDDGGGDTKGEVWLFTHEDSTHIKFNLDATSSLITFNAALGPLGVLIIGGDGQILINVDFFKTGGTTEDIEKLSSEQAINDAFNLFALSLDNSFIVNLPVYFPNASSYVGDIEFEATWDDSGLEVTKFDIPDAFDTVGFFDDFSFTSSVPLAIEALDQLLQTLQGFMSGQILGIPLPIIGDRLADAAEFVEDLRNDIIKPFRELLDATQKTDEELVDMIQAFLFAILGPGVDDPNLQSDFPELVAFWNGLGLGEGLDLLGSLDYADIDTLIQLIYVPDNFRIEWKFNLGDTYKPDIAFDFDIGLPALGLEMDGGLAVEITWSLALGIGISSSEGAYVHIGEENDLHLSIDAGFTPGSELTGRLGFLQLSATDEGIDVAENSGAGNGISDTNHIAASFDIKLTNGNDAASPYLSLFDLGALEVAAHVAASADLGLLLELAFNRDLLPPVVSAILPAIQSGFVFAWAMPEENILSDSFTFDFAGYLTSVKFTEIYLDLGSFLGDFLGPIVAKIQEYTDPLQPIIEILTARIPVLSDLAGKTITLVDIAATFGEFDPGLIYSIADLITFVNSIPAEPGSVMIQIADEFVIVGSGLFDTLPLKQKLTDSTFNFADAVNPESGSFVQDLFDNFSDPSGFTGTVIEVFDAAGNFISGALGSAGSTPEGESVGGLFGGDFNSEERGGFDFPFLKDPVSILGALLGKPIVLVTYDLAPLVVEFNWEVSFPIYPPLYGVVGAGIGVKIDLAFGYDTKGVQDFVAGGFENPLDLLSGFYISDTENPDGSGADVPELQFKGQISVGAELNAGIASAGVKANIILTVNFDVNDPDRDGRVRISELLGNFLYELREGSPALAPLAIFDIYGDISFLLSAYIKILMLKLEFEITPKITLFEFSIEFDRQPILATERGDGDSLLLNVGPNAGSRLHGENSDSGEEINVKWDGGQWKVWSNQMGVGENSAQSYDGDSIVIYGGDGDDTIYVDTGDQAVPVYIEGGSGNDTITVVGDGIAEIYGNDGDDTLKGGNGNDIIFGGEGSEILIDGGAGDDIIFGDTGRISENIITGYLRDKDGADTISGGADRDIIFGNGKEDKIGGDGTFDENNPDSDTTGGGDLIIGDGGRLVRPEAQEGAWTVVDVIEGWSVQSTDFIGGRSDIIHGHGGPDIIYAGQGDDDVDGGEGNDTIHGQTGFDTLAGAGGSDTIRGYVGDDVIFGFRYTDLATDPWYHNQANTDEGDEIYGDDGNDFIRGNDGNDVIYGGRGSDIIFGDWDDDKTYGEADNDFIFGGPGNELSMQGGDGNDIIFGDDGVVVYINFGTLPYAATSFESRLGHEIVGNHRLIGDGAFSGTDAFIGADDNNFRTQDVIQTEVNGLTDGDDYIVGGKGDDIALGGSGNDTIFGDFDPDPLERPDGPTPANEDILIGDGGRIEFYERERDNIRSIVAAAPNEFGSDHIYGNGANDVIFGSGGDDFLYGRMDPVYNSDPAIQEEADIRDDDIILGDDGEIDYETGTGIILTIETYFDTAAVNAGGSDHAYGNKHDDIIFGGIAGDVLKGDDGTDGDDVILGDNGLIVYEADDTLDADGNDRIMIATIETTDTEESTGGPDTIEGQDDNDVIIGGVNNGGPDLLYGDVANPTSATIAADGQDIILGDNGSLIFNAEKSGPVRGDLDTLDYIISETEGNGGDDEISGNAGSDVLIGSTGGDLMYGDDATASAGASDGEDIMLGDNGDIDLIGSVGRLLVQVIGRDIPSAVDLIETTDTNDDYGGADTMSGNAMADIMLGGVNDGGEDWMFGDRGDRNDTNNTVPADQDPTPATIALDGDDIMLGDNGLLDFTYLTDTDRNTLDLIKSSEDELGGTDDISGDKGLDVGIGGTGDDTIYGDNRYASAAGADLGDLLMGDNANIFLVAVDGATGPDLKVVLDAAVKTITTTDNVYPTLNTGGVDTISGNAKGDIIAGGVEGDYLYGDRETPTAATTADDGDDIIFGDNGSFEWLSSGRFAEIYGIDIAANNPELYAWFTVDPIIDPDLGTLDLITTEQPNNGGRDWIYGDEGNDLLFGGTDLDTMYGDDGDQIDGFVVATDNKDVMFGDHGRLYPQFARWYADPADSELVQASLNSRNFFAIDTRDVDGGEGDRMWGEEGDDLMLGQQGDDRMWGGSDDDDMIGGHNVKGVQDIDAIPGNHGGYDELDSPVVSGVLNPPDSLPMNDIMDGGTGNDSMAGDNTIIWRRGDVASPRFRELTGDQIYTTGPDTITTNITSDKQLDPDQSTGRDVELLDHDDGIEATPNGRYGQDVMAGGPDADVMYGQLGDDLMQGDGAVESLPNNGVDEEGDAFVTHVLAVDDGGNNPDTDETLYFNIPEAVTDGDDYMEGNGGNDLMYGGLGQDDMIGGSSALFGLDAVKAAMLSLAEEALRPDGSDIIFGGAGIDIDYNDIGDASWYDDLATTYNEQVILTDPTGHANDADFIMGDNANVYRVVVTNIDPNVPDVFHVYNFDLSFNNGENSEDRGSIRIIPRAMEQLDYTLGGADYASLGQGYTAAGAAIIDGVADNGLADIIHGEAGDDVIFGMTGSDAIYGEGQDDDVVGGYGNDWVAGGTGQDGVLGDDGLILTSRNSETGEPLNGIAGLLDKDASPRYSNGDALDELIYTPGTIQIAIINVRDALKKTADLVPFSYDPDWLAMDDEFSDDDTNTPYADDIIFGGLGSDFLHGGSGDDAISGAEALPDAYVTTFDGDGNPNGVLNLGYNAFQLPNPINPGDVISLSVLEGGDVLAFNPVDLDGQHLNNRFRAGEFFLYNEYDPRRKIMLSDSGELWEPGDPGNSYEFLLNFDETASSLGVTREAGVVPKATGQQTETYPQVYDDGKDVIFGDNGNDWLVGGTGRDNIYGGWGNDLLNADDKHDINDDSSKQNTVSDTHPTYEDRAYGGAGRDVLIGNTGGDRLIDWVGEYNSYLVPYAPFGQASVSRTLQPFLPEFLYALSFSDGADPTRYVDAIGTDIPEPTKNKPNPSRNGEPHGELGMVLQRDFAWQAQTGAPADPQAGNIPGGHRDVLRSAGFNDGSSSGFFANSGTWEVEDGAYQVAPIAKGADALSVFHVDEFIPGYFEMLAMLKPNKPTGGYKSNAYIIFDYQSETDFKFAGINVSTNKLEIGHRTEEGWMVDVQGVYNSSLKSDTNYHVFLALNGSTVTLVVDNKVSLTHAFDPRIDYYGIAHGLSDGMVGLGADNSIASIDNVIVQRLSPVVTYTNTDSFDTSVSGLFLDPDSGAWVVAAGAYTGAADSASAVNLMALDVSPAALIRLGSTLTTIGVGGFLFDYYGPSDFKFVTISPETGEVTIGHRTAKGWFTDAVFRSYALDSAEHELEVTLKGSTVSVTMDGMLVLGHAFNAIVTDGSYGLLAAEGATSYAEVTFQTDDPAYSLDHNPDPVVDPDEPVPVTIMPIYHEPGSMSVTADPVADESDEAITDDPAQTSENDAYAPMGVRSSGDYQPNHSSAFSTAHQLLTLKPAILADSYDMKDGEDPAIRYLY